MESDTDRIARLKHLTEQVLPELARRGRWPIRFDHCFKRVCFDWAFQDVWYRHLAKPAETHLRGEPLQRALTCAEELAARDDIELLNQRNSASLSWRGKRGPEKKAKPALQSTSL